jgi:hypothetical protein
MDDNMRVLASPYLEPANANPFQHLLYKSMDRLGVTIQKFRSRHLVTGNWDVWGTYIGPKAFFLVQTIRLLFLACCL